ncbi:MAG: hypothetical protein LUG85_04205 [Clostridiales bacterium]|nr:hypothetical protein [Clostridiales bacterium]
MKIKSIVFGDDLDPSFPKIESVITNSFAAITGNDTEYPSVYSSVQGGMQEIARALKTSTIIAVFADERMYQETKRCICTSFHFDMIHNERVLEKLKSLNNSERYMMHALMPKNATPFPLSDGLYSGFAIRSKSQCIFFLPLSEDRTFITMKKYVFPYIQRLYGTALPNFSRFETAYAADTLERQLLLSDVQIAIANTPVCKYIAHASKQIECFNDHISYAPYDKKHEDRDISKLSAVLAAEYYECQFGASIVEGDRDLEGNFTATITISNRETATIRTLSSIPDETHEDFMTTVVTEFFMMLAAELAHAPEIPKEELKSVKPSPAIHAARIVIYAILFAAAFFLTYAATSLSDLSIFG